MITVGGDSEARTALCIVRVRPSGGMAAKPAKPKITLPDCRRLRARPCSGYA